VSTRSAQRPAGAPPAGPLTAGSLCSGYGGLDLAVMAVTGARLAWCAETDRYAADVLAHHWPGVPNLGDLTALNWATVPPVDLVSAEWPCQDISYAGRGAGITEGTRSGLWLHIAVGLRHLGPSYVYLENVAALRTRGLATVLGDLAALGYDTQWTCLRASDAGAPHRRDRLLVLAVRPGAAARLAAAAHPGHRLLAQRPRAAGRPARQRAPERPRPGRRGHGPERRAGVAGRPEHGRVGGV
jgi:DNA (cytosine-5)-methyltransferase 1